MAAIPRRLPGLVVLTVFAGAWMASAHADPSVKALPKGASFVTAVEGIEEYRLQNGLRVLLFPDPSKETATVNVTYLVGSRHEGYGESGMAHLLEHLLFKGSANHRDIPQELTAHGCRPNGSTWFDRTNYFETFSASDANVDWALDLEADRMVNSFVARKDLDSEMSVVRNEFEVDENDPGSILEERIYSSAFLWHNYGKATIGSRADIENVPIERLQAFYKKWYRPDNAVLVVSGQFDPKRTLGVIQTKFGRLTNPSQPIEPTYTAEPAQDGDRTVTLRRVGDIQVAGAAYHVPAAAHVDHPAVWILSYLLGDEPSGRLHKTLVETQRATSVRCNADRFHDPGLLFLRAEVPKDKPLTDVRDDMVRLAEEFGGTPVTKDDLQRAQTNYLRNFERSMRNSSTAAIGLSEWAAMGDWRLMFLYRDRIQQVTADDVMRVAATYLTENNRTTGLYEPTEGAERVEVPAAQPLDTALAGYTGGEAMALGEAFDPTPANVEARVKRVHLPVGLNLVMLPKETRGEAVNINVLVNLGNADALRGKREVGNLAAEMLRRGTKSRSRQQIEDETEHLHATLNLYGGPTALRATVEAQRSAITDMLALVADVLRNPSFPPDEFAQAKQASIAENEQQKSDPRSQAFTTLMRHLSPWPTDDVRYMPMPEEAISDLERIKVGDLAAFHRDFYGASSMQIAIVGDFDTAEMEALVAKLFGDWKSKTPYAYAPMTYSEQPPLVSSIESPDKESASFAGGMRMALRDDDADFPGLTLGSYITGGGFLNSRLATRIRRTDGLSYGVGAWFNADERVPSASFQSWAIYAPQNDERLVKAFQEEIQRVLDGGFTDIEVSEAKSGWLQSRQVSRSQDAELAGRLARYAELGRTLGWDADLEKKVSALSSADVLEAFKRHIDLKRFSMVRAGDFAKRTQEAVAN